jgi:hypothetical protein
MMDGTEHEKQEALGKLTAEMEKGLRESQNPQLVFYDDQGRPKLNLGLFNSAPHVLLGGEQSPANIEEASIRLEVEDIGREPVLALDGHVARIDLRVNLLQPELTFTSKKNAVRFLRRSTGKKDYLYEPGIKWMGEKEEGQWDEHLSQMAWPGIAE